MGKESNMGALRRRAELRNFQDEIGLAVYKVPLSNTLGEGGHKLRIRYLHGRGRQELGEASFYVWRDSALIKWFDFYPNWENVMQTRKGYGTFAHVAAMMVAEYLYGDSYMIGHFDEPMYARKKQLEAMGIDYRRLYTFDEYLALSIGYAQEKGFAFDKIIYDSSSGHYSFPSAYNILNCSGCVKGGVACGLRYARTEEELAGELDSRAPVRGRSNTAVGGDPYHRQILSFGAGGIRAICMRGGEICGMYPLGEGEP